MGLQGLMPKLCIIFTSCWNRRGHHSAIPRRKETITQRQEYKKDIMPKDKHFTVGQLKKLVCLTVTLIFLSIGSSFVFCHEKNDANQSERSAYEDQTNIVVVGGMYVEPEQPEPGDEFTLGFRIKNNSTVVAEDLNVTVDFPAQLELVSGSKKIVLGDLVPDQERFVSWRFRAKASGDCIIDLDFETTNLGNGQSKWLLEVFPEFTSILLDPLFQLFAVIGVAAVLILLAVIIKRHFQGNKDSKR